jgi:hypothetical protein
MRNTYDVRNLTASITPDFIPDWKDAPEDAVCVAMDEDGSWYWYDCIPNEPTTLFQLDGAIKCAGSATNADLLPPDYWKSTLMMRPDAKQPEISHYEYELDLINPPLEEKLHEPNYTHLLPDGYEFCEEADAEKWVKVESLHFNNELPIGYIEPNITRGTKPYYRPIRPIQYKVTTHEIVTAIPDPYMPDWSKAPEGTVSHAWDMDGKGFWCMTNIEEGTHWGLRYELSNLTLPADLDWKQSLRVKPN